MKLAKNLENLGTETAFAVLAEAKKLEAQGKSMIHMGLGQPGVERLLQNMYDEINRNMVLMGCKSLKELNSSKLIYRK